jgi:hypothetical protein
MTTPIDTAAIRARYEAACLAIGREDPSLTITDSHADVEHLLAVNADLVATLEKARFAMTTAMATTEQPLLRGRMNTECAEALGMIRSALSRITASGDA